MIKKLTLTTLVGFAALMLLGWLIWGVILKSTMETMYESAASCMNLEPSMLYVSLATLVQAFFLAWLLIGTNSNTLRRGAMTGGWAFLILSLMMGIWFIASFSFYTSKGMMYDIICNVFQAGIASGVMGYVLGKMNGGDRGASAGRIP